MQLHLSSQDWGLVTGAFAIAYALFEIPGGYFGDPFGARAMPTRIVLWWGRCFTTLTGFASKLWPLMITRFFFGAGEAGAYPTASTSVFRWFHRYGGITFQQPTVFATCAEIGKAVHRRRRPHEYGRRLSAAFFLH